MQENNELINPLEVEYYDLKSKLSSAASDIGDWKIAKIQEYAMMGQESPYDIQELHQKRQKVRDRINEIEVLLNM